jgi:putative nucleotidyltransferase with HDIG domain
MLKPFSRLHDAAIAHMAFAFIRRSCAAPALSAEEREDRARAAAAALLAAAAAPGFKLPMLPEVATEAMALARDPNVAMIRLQKVIVRDVVLAARVLKLASSSAFGGQPAHSLTGALQRLGSQCVRDILYQSVMEAHVFRGADEQSLRAERDHCVAVARLTNGMCKMRGGGTELGFICGLVHDLGRAALAGVKGHPTLAGLDRACLAAVHGIVHTALGAQLAQKWGLPSEAVECARRHHRFRDFMPGGGGYSEIGHLVAAADAVVGHLGIGRPAKRMTVGDEQMIRELGFEADAIIGVARQAFSAGV